MKTFLMLLKVVIAIILLSLAAENISKPSNFYVFIGIIEVLMSLILLYKPVKLLISKF